jgi:hypothetical protein
MTLRAVSFQYPGQPFEVSSLYQIEGGKRELVHHEIPDELFALGISLAIIDQLADEACDKEGIIA